MNFGYWWCAMEELAVLILAALVGSTVLKKRCGKCGVKWRRLGECPVCARQVCSHCGTGVFPQTYLSIEISTADGTCCQEHLAEFQEEIDRRRRAAAVMDSVAVFSKNYRGRAPEVQLDREIESYPPVKDKEEAERLLRFFAALEGAEVIVDFEFVRHTEQDGNYKYATWTAIGLI